ncbi:MAG: SIS domain-containing protein [Fibrobacterota bacterium]|nr:SIS domain-containing protein [Fibrobacterota bacterium]
MDRGDQIDPIAASLAEGCRTLELFSSDPANLFSISAMAGIIARGFLDGNKVLVCGNGGSAYDALHFAQEFTGRFRKERRALPVIALSEAAHLTCVGNDYGFDEVFARGVAAYGRQGDILVALSTSGNSRNIVRAVEEAGRQGLSVLLFLGRDGGTLKDRGDLRIVVPGLHSDRIQEIHMIALHILIECVERRMFPANYPD